MKMISLETKANNNNNQFPAGANQRPIEHMSVESSSQASQPVMAEWQENVYQRLQAVKDMYFVELKDLFQELNYRCQKPMLPDQSEKFKRYKAELQRLLNYFNAPKNAIPTNFKEEHVEALEKRAQNILNSFRPKPSGQQQPGQQQIQNQMGQGQPMQQQSQPQTVQGQPMKGQSQPQLGHVQLMQQQSQSHMEQVPQEQKHVTLFQQMNLQPWVSSMMQQPNAMQQDLQQRLQASGGLLPQQQNTLDQQKQLLQQRGLSEASSTSVESSSQAGQPVIAEWQEKVYLRLQAMKDLYFVELKDLFQKLNYRCQKPMPPDQSEKFKHYKAQLQRVLNYFNAPKYAIPVNFKEEHVEALEKRLQNILNSVRPKPSALQQPGQQQVQNQMGQGQPMQQQSQPQMGQGQPMQQQSQPQMGHMQSMQQQSQSQMGQVPQEQFHVMPFQQMNLQPSVSSMQPNTVAPLQNSTMPLIQQSSGQVSQQTMQTPMQSQAALNTQEANVNSLQQSSANQIPHNPLQHNNIRSLQQRGINTMQSCLQQGSNNPHGHIPQAQQLKHLQQQRILQMQWQKQAAQLQHQLQAPQVSKLNDNDAKLKQGPMKSTFMQPYQMNQRAVLQQQQQHLKQASSLSASSPQILPAGSPQVSQQSSPQVDQQSLLASPLQTSKVGTPLQPATSPFLNPSPSNLPVPSLIDDSERQPSVTTSVSTVAGTQGFQQSVSPVSLAQSLAIGTPRISILILMLGLMLVFLMLGLMTLRSFDKDNMIDGAYRGCSYYVKIVHTRQ